MTKLILGLILAFSSTTFGVFYFGPPSWYTSGHSHTPGGSTAAPEIDPASALSALTLLLGGVTVLRSRSSRK